MSTSRITKRWREKKKITQTTTHCLKKLKKRINIVDVQIYKTSERRKENYTSDTLPEEEIKEEINIANVQNNKRSKRKEEHIA